MTDERCRICDRFIGGPHGTESMAHGSCTFTDGGSRCVFGPGHEVDYHHLQDGRNVADTTEASDAPMTALPLEPHTEAEEATLARFEGAEPAPESNDDALWETLSNLIPCNEFAGCTDECECVEGELRLAIQRLIVAERGHAVDCEGDDCCVALEHRARLVNKAAALTPEALRTRRAALRGQANPVPAIAVPVAQSGEGR